MDHSGMLEERSDENKYSPPMDNRSFGFDNK